LRGDRGAPDPRVTLLLKLVLVPGLIALVTVAGRRFGPRIGGWLNALPLVAGPVLFFLALEQGDACVARAGTRVVGLRAGRLDRLRAADRRAPARDLDGGLRARARPGRLRARAVHASALARGADPASRARLGPA